MTSEFKRFDEVQPDEEWQYGDGGPWCDISWCDINWRTHPAHGSTWVRVRPKVKWKRADQSEHDYHLVRHDGLTLRVGRDGSAPHHADVENLLVTLNAEDVR